MTGCFEIKYNHRGEYIFHLKNVDGVVLLTGEAKASKKIVSESIDLVKTNAFFDDMYETITGSDNRYFIIIKNRNHEILGTTPLFSPDIDLDRARLAIRNSLSNAKIFDFTVY